MNATAKELAQLQRCTAALDGLVTFHTKTSEFIPKLTVFVLRNDDFIIKKTDAAALKSCKHRSMVLLELVSFQWKNVDFLLQNVDFRLKSVGFIIQQQLTTERTYCGKSSKVIISQKHFSSFSHKIIVFDSSKQATPPQLDFQQWFDLRERLCPGALCLIRTHFAKPLKAREGLFFGGKAEPIIPAEDWDQIFGGFDELYLLRGICITESQQFAPNLGLIFLYIFPGVGTGSSTGCCRSSKPSGTASS